jgi:hypothetical protein
MERVVEPRVKAIRLLVEPLSKKLPTFVLASLLAIGAIIAASTPVYAKTKYPTIAQASHCAAAAKGHSVLTKAQVFDCTGLPLISQNCPNGPAAIVIRLGSANIALRQGLKPLKLGKSYSTSQLASICNRSESTGTAAPPSAIISPLFTGDAHPILVVPASAKGKVDLLFVGTPIVTDGNTTVPIVVWNGTGKTVNDIDVAGIAKNGAGTVIGSGDSQDIEPENLLPGDVAFGMVYFETAVPAGSDLSSLLPTYNNGQSTYFLDVQATQANFVQGSYGEDDITGSVMNQNKVAVSGPVSTVAYCFSTSGVLTSVDSGFTSGNSGLAPGQTGGYSDSLYDETCPTFLVGSSGFGQE